MVSVTVSLWGQSPASWAGPGAPCGGPRGPWVGPPPGSWPRSWKLLGWGGITQSPEGQLPQHVVPLVALH